MDYLAWLAEDEPARKEQRFAEMSTGWVIGSEGFAKAAVQAHAAALEAGGEFLLEGGGDRLDDGGDESPPRPFTAPPLHHPAPFVSVFTRTKK